MTNVARMTALAVALPLALGACQRPLAVSGAAAVADEPVVLSTTGTQVAAGTQFYASLDQTLSTQNVQLGDRFTMTLRSPILNRDRQTLVPAGARIEGTVTATRAATDQAAPSILRLDVNTIGWQGHTMPLRAEILDAAPRRSAPTLDEAATGAAAGAVVGAVLGTVIRGDTQGALQGAVIGAGAGTIISLGTASAQARLESGTVLTLRLTEPLASHH